MPSMEISCHEHRFKHLNLQYIYLISYENTKRKTLWDEFAFLKIADMLSKLRYRKYSRLSMRMIFSSHGKYPKAILNDLCTFGTNVSYEVLQWKSRLYCRPSNPVGWLTARIHRSALGISWPKGLCLLQVWIAISREDQSLHDLYAVFIRILHFIPILPSSADPALLRVGLRPC